MKLVLIVSLMLLTGCSCSLEVDSKSEEIEVNPNEMVEENLGNSIYRYSNNEAICYVFRGYKSGGMSCWKVSQ